MTTGGRIARRPALIRTNEPYPEPGAASSSRLVRGNRSAADMNVLRRTCNEEEENDVLGWQEMHIFYHRANVDPDRGVRYTLVEEVIMKLLIASRLSSNDWIWFILSQMIFLKLPGWPNDEDAPAHTWAPGFSVIDMTRAYVAMAMFFPEEGDAAPVTKFLRDPAYKRFRRSILFLQARRGMYQPSSTPGTGYGSRGSDFWKAYNIIQASSHRGHGCDMDWEAVNRRVTARLAAVGLISPSAPPTDSQTILGRLAHDYDAGQPNRPDGYVEYPDLPPFQLPSGATSTDKWPNFMASANRFEAQHPGARFAVLRLWSGPQYYFEPVTDEQRRVLDFVDNCGEIWAWNALPKDAPWSSTVMRESVVRRLALMDERFAGQVLTRGDVVLVMGKTGRELLKLCSCVTYALQSKPWNKEVDLYKSFINVTRRGLTILHPDWLK
ncbi:hypothetical protein AAL_02237 [Moelleriella libera RCEF 2490]|uniref:Uncharacterized protein n=1 Tax=Moelleriella libera RCEF 2490 TaxID=1081109 RepID=A0A168FAR9_9HYPO|nr:hypothetical protein AAL_02237 [Moelleriella libera RCEF 2490]